MARGTLIAESLRVGTAIDARIVVRRIERVRPTNRSAEQQSAGLPADWTLLFFEVDDEHAAPLANALAGALGDFGWYVDFHTDEESFLVFAGRIFRYPKGDAAGRAEARAYALSVGVPVAQADW